MFLIYSKIYIIQMQQTLNERQYQSYAMQFQNLLTIVKKTIQKLSLYLLFESICHPACFCFLETFTTNPINQYQ